MPGAGVEPARLAAADLKSAASANFATRAMRPRSESNRRIGVLQTPALPLGYAAVPDCVCRSRAIPVSRR